MNGRRRKIIAIDGPAGSGKSTAARLVAEQLGYLYIDTGAMYRAATWKAMEEGLDLTDAGALAASASRMDIRLANGRVMVDGLDATEAIRSPAVTNNVFRLADIRGVRDAMVIQQRRLGREGGAVVEGRDTGTIVFPDADVKIYIDAAVEERARRRFKEFQQKGIPASLDSVKAEIHERDRRDKNRRIAPLKAAEGAFVLDTTGLTIDATVRAVIEIAFGRTDRK